MGEYFISQSCSWLWASLDFDNFTDESTYFKLSGLGPDRLGIYKECVEIGNEYFLMEARLKQDGYNFFMGMCMNKKCSASDVLYISNSLNEFLNETFQILSIKESADMQEAFSILQIIILSIISLFLLFRVVMTVKRKKPEATENAKLKSILWEFSFQASIHALFEKRSNNERIKMFSGLKVLSFIGIVICNTYIMLKRTPTQPFIKKNNPIFYFVYSLSVDTWLALSGFYFAFECLKVFSKHRTYKILWKGLLKKFLRIWTISLMMMVVLHYILPLTGDGACWHQLTSYLQTECQNFIPFVFMVSNYFSSSCDYWLWLWQIELQLSFIFVLLLTLKFSPIKSRYYYGGQGILIIGSVLCRVFLQSQTSFDKLEDLEMGIEKWSIVRCIPFIIGFNLADMFVDFRILKDKQKHLLIKIYKKRPFRFLSPFIGFALLYASSFFYTNLQFLPLEEKVFALSLTMTTIINVISIIFIILPAFMGYPSFISTFLSDWVFVFISKLTFSAFAVQYLVTSWLSYNKSYDLYLDGWTVFEWGTCCLGITLLVGVVVSLSCEITLYRIIVKYLKWDNKKYNEF